jgi:hypothetical protein
MLDTQMRLQAQLKGPLAGYLESQQRLQEAMKGPMSRYLESQKRMQETLQRTGYLESQQRLQEAMKGPLASFLATQGRIRRAVAGSVNTLTVEPEEVGSLVDALAAVEPDETSEPQLLTSWLAVAVNLPTIARLRLASELMGIAIAAAMFAETAAGTEVDPTVERAQAAVALLFALVGYLLRFREQPES